MANRIGQQFGNYRLLKLLGDGGFADVYLGKHIHLGTLAAIKVLTTKLTEDEIEQFRNEARMMISLKHSNIMRVLDFGLADHIPFIVMDYAPGGSLRKLHPRGTRLPLAMVIDYIKQIAAALQYIHDQKLIHRDIKSENMLLGSHNEILLSDFGIATIAHSTRSLNTQDGSGTIYYMSPEQLQGKPRTLSDQYSLAVVVYEWLCGIRPFNGTYWEIASQHLSVLPPPPTVFPPEVGQVILKALAKNPYERFANIQAFATALEQASQPKVSLGTTLITYSGHSSGVNTVAWSPNGKYIASGSGDFLSTPEIIKQMIDGGAANTQDATVQIWEALTGKLITTYHGHKSARLSPDYYRSLLGGRISSLAWSPDSKFIASVADNECVHVWDITNPRDLFTSYEGDSDLNEDHRIEDLRGAVSWSADGRYIAFAFRVGQIVRVWDVTTKRSICDYKGHSYFIYDVVWSPDAKHVASSDGQLRIWNITTLKDFYIHQSDSRGIHRLAWSPDGARIAFARLWREIMVYDVLTGNQICTYSGHPEYTGTLAWSPSGKYIASAGDNDSTVHVWEAATGNALLIYRGHSGPVRTLAWSPDGKYIASGGRDKVVHIWRAA